jgi:hypothetical protein
MKVICKGFRDCRYKDNCPHSKEHEFDSTESKTSCIGYQLSIDHKCYCDQKHLRLKKLEKLRNI